MGPRLKPGLISANAKKVSTISFFGLSVSKAPESQRMRSRRKTEPMPLTTR